MKKVLLVMAVLAAGMFLIGCSTFGYSSSGCSGSSGCNAIFYCGEAGCAGFFGGQCNC